MNHQRIERIAHQLGVSVHALEQYLQLKRVEVAPEAEEPVRRPVREESGLPGEVAGGS